MQVYVVVLLLVALGCQAVAANDEQQDVATSVRDAKLLAYFSTTTVTSLTTYTKQALSTCWSTSNMACSGRRKRRSLFSPKDSSIRDMEADMALDSSVLSDVTAAVVEETESSQRTGKKLTVWSTNFTTVTKTTTSYYEGTTVTVSALCTIAGMGQSCFG